MASKAPRAFVLSVAAALLAATSAGAEPMVGPGVGNADLLLTEGARLYNEKSFEAARASFVKAARAAPGNAAVYLSLARAHFAVKEVELACQAYRTFIKAAPTSPDREKAQGELELCERQQAAAPRPEGVPSLGQTYVSLKAAFYEALDKGVLVGPKSATEQLQALLVAGYAAPDLADMAGKLGRVAESTAEAAHKKAVSRQSVTAEELRRAAELYRLALDCGATLGTHLARAAFVEGMAALREGKYFQAEAAFADAASRDPADTEARFQKGLARYLSGDRAGGLAALRSELPGDPRTAVLEMASALDGGGDAAGQLQKLLFARRYKAP